MATTAPAPSSARVILAALASNVGVMIAKFVAFAFTGSASMLAEALHSVADAGNQSLMLVGERRSRRRATPAHPFGFGSERYFWGFVVATVLFALGSLFSLVEGEEKLRRPHPVESPGWAIAVLLVGGALEAWSLRTAVRRANLTRGDLGWLEFVRRTKSSELPVVLLEDSGALAGLALALAGIVLSVVTGIDRFDAIGSLAIGVLLGVIAVFLAGEMRSLLVGESASTRRQAQIRQAIDEVEGVHDVARLDTLQIGPEDILVEADATVDPELTVDEAHDIEVEAEEHLRSAVPTATHTVVRAVPDDGDDEVLGTTPTG